VAEQFAGLNELQRVTLVSLPPSEDRETRMNQPPWHNTYFRLFLIFVTLTVICGAAGGLMLAAAEPAPEAAPAVAGILGGIAAFSGALSGLFAIRWVIAFMRQPPSQ
jgi:hypothetical protein